MGVFEVLQWLLFLSAVPPVQLTDGVVRNGKSTAGHQRYLCSHRCKTWQLQFTYTASNPVRTRKSLIYYEWRWMPGNSPHYGRWPQHDFTSLKTQAAVGNPRIQPGSDVIVCGNGRTGLCRAKSPCQRCWFYAYDRLRKTVVAHVFGERIWRRRWGVL